MAGEVQREKLGGFTGSLGVEVIKRDTGYSHLILAVQESHLHPGRDTVHGAVLFAITDSGMFNAIRTSLAKDEIGVTLENKITYLRAATRGEIEAETRVVYRGRNFAMLESEVRQNSTVVAKATGTYAIVAKPPPEGIASGCRPESGPPLPVLPAAGGRSLPAQGRSRWRLRHGTTSGSGA